MVLYTIRFARVSKGYWQPPPPPHTPLPQQQFVMNSSCSGKSWSGSTVMNQWLHAVPAQSAQMMAFPHLQSGIYKCGIQTTRDNVVVAPIMYAPHTEI